jgi:glutamyl-tRNA synthetase/glutamyl-Q tRNA(Asp) synthetase
VFTRFAPSPTGFLHLGHLLNAVAVWTLARRAGGRVRLRIEDHDRERARPEFERAILDDLEWLGFEPDEPSVAEFRAGACDGRQSDHPERYASALASLAGAAHVYGCTCSRREILERGATSEADGTLRYDGHCRSRGLPLTAGVGVRVVMDPGGETFDDGWMGPQRQDPAEQCGDVLVRDRRGNWTYQFAVVVDDRHDGITDVIRGRDLLPSTGRQIRLARLLGRERPPRFHHHPLILGADGEKLSKSRGDVALRELRASGVTPAEAIARASALAGWTP